MNFFEHFRKLFGFSPSSDDPGPTSRNEYFEQRRFGGNEHDDEEEDFFDRPRRFFGQPHHFQMFSGDPLEIHKFFEQQMEEMMKGFNIFGMFGEESRDNSIYKMLPENKLTPRQEVLKPEYWHSSPGMSEKLDTDIDDKITKADLDQILTKEHQDNSQGIVAVPETRKLDIWSPQIRSVSKSVTRKTIRRPDGTLEHHCTEKDSKGGEKVIVTRQIGDMEHTVVTKINADGVREQVESFVNMDEGSLPEFERKWNNGSTKIPEKNDYSDEQLFRNLFKWP